LQTLTDEKALKMILPYHHLKMPLYLSDYLGLRTTHNLYIGFELKRKRRELINSPLKEYEAI